ncbi:ABC transporter ATP-binding protein [Peijinzhouia sedimentorum]
MSTVIKVENVSKLYRLGEVGTGTLSHDLNRWYHRLRGKEDPYLKIGESNDRAKKSSSEYVYALKDINFEVKEGEVLGIIGKNGAGKSTLLKLLSRVTGPSSGSIKIKGRTASLLEVGTGFHPELTGRENIFLNGAILGMTKSEIRRKFDEIVDFSGVERYIDTPVKRYSSGMYVRLAFAVAAHLDPEILIVDEVLAVGDAEFQKRCLGKMGDISKNEGRTILFVSHNMAAVKSLCSRSIFLENGTIGVTGKTNEVIDYYLSYKPAFNVFNFKEEREIESDMKIREIQLLINGKKSSERVIDTYEQIGLEFLVEIKDQTSNHCLFYQCCKDGEVIFANFEVSSNNQLLFEREGGLFRCSINLPRPLFKPGSYYFDFHVSRIGHGSKQFIPEGIVFEIDLLSINPRFSYLTNDKPGRIAIDPIWNYEKIR